MMITQKILDRLKQSEYWTSKTRESGATIQGLTCPACGIVGAGWCYSDSPMSINCNRMSRCGARTRTLEIFNIRQDIEKEYKPTRENPDRPARKYLESRGIKNSLKGLKFTYWKNVRKTGTGAVMFPIGKIKNGKTVMNGRLINPPPGEGKTHNSGSTSGLFWQHPGCEYDPYKPTYIAEGIINALSIVEIGHQALAVISSGQDPAKVDLSFFHKLTLAFDADQAGAMALKKWKSHYPDAGAIMPDPGGDWNDLLCSGPLEQVKKQFERNLPRYQVNANLALAETARDHATIYRDFHGSTPGIFEFNGCTYFSWIKKRGEDSHLVVERCGRFTLKVISFLKDTSNPGHPEYHYQLEITPTGGRPITAVASGKDLSKPGGIKEFFLTRAKISYEGAAASCTALVTMITGVQGAPEVNQVALTGYDVRSRWYVFKHFAIDPSGRQHHPDQRGLYKINFREWATPPPHAAEKAIKPAMNGKTPQYIHKAITDGWGDNGAAAMAWMTAGWFVYPIKEQIGFFPHLSCTGEPASGKSALATILNAMQGIDGEGIPISQLNSKKGLARTIARESGRFTALLEDSQRNERSFDYSIVLTGYNRGPLQVQAAFSNDLKTKVNEFLGTLMFVCNQEPFKDKQEKQRIISLYFSHDAITDDTRAAYERICKIPLPELARVMVLTLQQRNFFEKEWHKAYQQAIEDLSPQDNRRILQNHALVLAFHRLFCQIHKIDYDLTAFMRKKAEQKCITSAERGYTSADHFFETLDNLPDDKLESFLHLDAKKRLIYINLAGAEQVIRNRGLQFSVNDRLIEDLKAHPAYVRHGLNYRFPGGEVDSQGRIKQKRSWVFHPDGFKN